ncbi:MAG: hypothetical protein ACR2NW_05225 [Thermodesulfobacteriota bacterium]
MEPNWCLISEILITLRINNNIYEVNSDNFPQYDCQELISNLRFLTDIGLVHAKVAVCNGEDYISHKLTCEGQEITEKLMEDYYDKLM